jgi:hypothetical protein
VSDGCDGGCTQGKKKDKKRKHKKAKGPKAADAPVRLSDFFRETAGDDDTDSSGRQAPVSSGSGSNWRSRWDQTERARRDHDERHRHRDTHDRPDTAGSAHGGSAPRASGPPA